MSGTRWFCGICYPPRESLSQAEHNDHLRLRHGDGQPGPAKTTDVWTAPERTTVQMSTAEKARYTGLSVKEIEEMGSGE